MDPSSPSSLCCSLTAHHDTGYHCEMCPRMELSNSFSTVSIWGESGNLAHWENVIFWRGGILGAVLFFSAFVVGTYGSLPCGHREPQCQEHSDKMSTQHEQETFPMIPWQWAHRASGVTERWTRPKLTSQCMLMCRNKYWLLSWILPSFLFTRHRTFSKIKN